MQCDDFVNVALANVKKPKIASASPSFANKMDTRDRPARIGLASKMYGDLPSEVSAEQDHNGSKRRLVKIVLDAQVSWW